MCVMSITNHVINKITVSVLVLSFLANKHTSSDRRNTDTSQTQENWNVVECISWYALKFLRISTAVKQAAIAFATLQILCFSGMTSLKGRTTSLSITCSHSTKLMPTRDL